MLELLVGAAVVNGIFNSKAKKAAEEARKKNEKKIAKLQKELRELKGEKEESGGVLSWLFS